MRARNEIQPRLLKMVSNILFTVFVAAFLINCSTNSKPNAHQHSKSELASTQYVDDDESHAGEIHIEPEVIKEVGIEVVPLTKRLISSIKSYPGLVVPRPDGEALVGSLVSGRVVEILVGLGDKISRGASLCRIESPEIGAAQSAYIRSVAENNFAQKDFLRHKKLNEENISSEKTLLEKESRAQSAQAELAAAERALHSVGFSQTEIDNLISNHSTSGVLTLRSPISGTVVYRSIRLGQRIDTNSDLFHIVALPRLWVKMSLYEKDLAFIHENSSLEIIPQSFPEIKHVGKVVQIGREVNEETRTVNCFIEVSNHKGVLIPNLFVTCNLKIKLVKEPVLALPEEAVVIDEHGDRTVFVEHEPNNFILKGVEVGPLNEGWYELLGGLELNERVVCKGAFFIKSEFAKGSFGHGHAH